MRHLNIQTILQFTGLFLLWIILSGRLQARYIILGALASVLIVAINRRMSFRTAHRNQTDQKGFRFIAFFFAFIPWLAWQVVTANIQVAMMVLHPRLPIDPKVMVMRTNFRRASAITLLGNSITLTPGTLTVDVVDSAMVIHALSESSAGVLFTGELQDKVARLFHEEDTGPEITILPSFEPVRGKRRTT